MNPIIRFSLVIFSSLLCWSNIGCESTKQNASTSTAETSTAKELTAPFAVQRGTPATELIEHLGEPQRRYPFNKHGVTAEVWVYEQILGTDSELVITDTRTQIFWDHVQGVMVEYEEPVYEHQASSTVQITEILLVDQVVSAWKRRSEGEAVVSGKTR